MITGGAGFVGSNLALAFKKHFSGSEVIALDNLKRRGSELSLQRLREGGVTFVHGDVRVREDILDIKSCDTLIDCSAEPSVLAGNDGSPDYVIQTNLVGTINCLEAARRWGSSVMFLSTSRVYPVSPINALSFREEETRFTLESKQKVRGASGQGISEEFPLEGARSLYGASKLSSELLLHEYIDTYKLKGIINRCGVITGPWQMGKVDQGVVVLWVAKHYFKKPLSYIGYGGSGKQVRDILHVQDLFNLVKLQLEDVEKYSDTVFNVGGGTEISVSLRELTELCIASTKNTVKIDRISENRPNDLISYISDCQKIQSLSGWRPTTSPRAIVEEITRWIHDHRVALEPILA